MLLALEISDEGEPAISDDLEAEYQEDNPFTFDGDEDDVTNAEVNIHVVNILSVYVTGGSMGEHGGNMERKLILSATLVYTVRDKTIKIVVMNIHTTYNLSKI